LDDDRWVDTGSGLTLSERLGDGARLLFQGSDLGLELLLARQHLGPSLVEAVDLGVGLVADSLLGVAPSLERGAFGGYHVALFLGVTTSGVHLLAEIGHLVSQVLVAADHLRLRSRRQLQVRAPGRQLVEVARPRQDHGEARRFGSPRVGGDGLAGQVVLGRRQLLAGIGQAGLHPALSDLQRGEP
jgi:hypothetical protein